MSFSGKPAPLSGELQILQKRNLQKPAPIYDSGIQAPSRDASFLSTQVTAFMRSFHWQHRSPLTSHKHTPADHCFRECDHSSCMVS